MKLRKLFFAALSVLAFAACTETPESPYNPGGNGGNDNGTTATGDNLLKNSSFETWAEGKPTSWGLTVTNGTYSQSNEANTGESSVLLNGYASSNKRLASKSYTLKPGTYTLAAYMKQSGETIGQARIGYAKLTNGIVADTQNDYIYLTSASAVSSSWKKTSEKFTLTEQTEIAVIIMNSKYGEGAAILVDDVTLTTVDGGIVEGTESDEPETPAEKPEGTYISESFAANLGSFTTQQTVGNYPWVNDYSTAKATSYVNTTEDANEDGKPDTDNDAISWLVSPAVDFTEETEAYAAFEYIIRYSESGKVAENHQLLISADYKDDVATATWIDLPYNAVEGSDWQTFYKANVNIPAEFLGKANITFAFRYTGTETKAGTWEVRNFIVAHGKVEATETPDTPDTPDTPNEAGEYTVTEALAAFVAGEAKDAVVKGYIVGSIDDKSISDANFSGAAVLKSNLLLADNADETDIAKCLAIQLPSGAVRDALNLVDNPGNYKKYVTLTGSLEKYFGVAGLKNVKKYTIDGEASEEPETPETPEQPETPEEPETPVTPDTPAEAGVFDFTNPEALTPSVERATVAAGSTQGAGVEASEYTFTNGGVTVKVSQGSAGTPVRFWTRTGGDVELRTYNGSTITVSVSEGTMSSIVFEGGKVSDMSANTGSFSAGKWSGSAQSVTFSVSKTLNIQKLTVK